MCYVANDHLESILSVLGFPFLDDIYRLPTELILGIELILPRQMQSIHAGWPLVVVFVVCQVLIFGQDTGYMRRCNSWPLSQLGR